MKNQKQITDDLIAQNYIEENQSKPNFDNNIDRIKRNFHKINNLSFSYQSINKISGLKGLQNLQVLRLDNNMIQKIENLDKVPNLIKLDLSFNHIETIENLDKLVLLEDLSLFHNKIQYIQKDKIDFLQNLQYFSLGYNHLKDFQSVMNALRSLSKLRIVKLNNNSFSQDPDYRVNTIKSLPWISYLDGKLISQQEKFDLGILKQREIPNDSEGQQNDALINKQSMILEIVNSKMESFSLINYDKYLLMSNNEMRNLLKMNNKFEDSTQKFNESVKIVTDQIKLRITENYMYIQEIQELYGVAMEQIMKENHQEKQEEIQDYQQKKILAQKLLDEKDDINRTELLQSILKDLENLEQKLIQKEMDCKVWLQKGFHKIDQNMKIVQKKIENNIIGDNGIKQIDGSLTDFFSRFLEEAIQEAQKFEHFFENGVESNSGTQALKNPSSQFMDEETENFFGSIDDLKTGVQNIKDSIETTHWKQESVIQKVIDLDIGTYLESKNELIKRYTRTNIFNITQLVQKERALWAEYKDKPSK